MMKFITTLGAAAILAMGFTTSAQAGPIGGAQYAVDNSCFIIWWFFVSTDCSYDGTRAANVPVNSSLGPILLYSYQRPGGGDNKRLRLDGDMTVTGSAGAGDVIDATLSLAAGERFGSCGQGGNCTEAWSSITHTISAGADRAATNAAGGFTYEVAANVFPARLEPCTPYIVGAPFPPGPANMLPFGCGPFGPFLNPDYDPDDPEQTPDDEFFEIIGFNFANQLFPSVTASPAFPFKATAWQAQAPIGEGIASFEGGRGNRNIGTTSSAVATDYSCEGGDCAAAGLMANNGFGYENLLMKVDTNAAGGIISAQLAYTQEYVLVVPAFGDSWDGNFADLSGFVAVAKPGGSPNIQVEKKNPLAVVIYGTDKLDVSSIEIDSLQLGPGLFYTMETYGGEIHGKGQQKKAHIGDTDGDGNDDLTVHFASNESDLRCGFTENKLNGVSDGVAFTTTVTTNGIGNTINMEGEKVPCP